MSALVKTLALVVAAVVAAAPEAGAAPALAARLAEVPASICAPALETPRAADAAPTAAPEAASPLERLSATQATRAMPDSPSADAVAPAAAAGGPAAGDPAAAGALFDGSASREPLSSPLLRAAAAPLRIAGGNALKLKRLARRALASSSRPARAPAPSLTAAEAGVSVEQASGLDTKPVSLRRSLKHSFGNWLGARALRIPLTRTDHMILLGLTYVPDVLVAAAATAAGKPAFAAVSLVWNCLTVFGVFHMVELRHVARVARNARAFPAAAAAAFDADLLSRVESFQRETGWRVAWVDSPEILAQADPSARRVYMSVGWIAASPKRGDRRRLAYLSKTLGTLAYAIKNAAPAATSANP